MFHKHSQQTWSGWSRFSAEQQPGLTLWLTGLPGSGKSTLAALVQQTLTMRGYKTEVIDSQTLSSWLQQELHITDDDSEQCTPGITPAYDSFITYLCMLLARHNIITIAASVSPYRATRVHARSQLRRFIEIYLHCSVEQRAERVKQPLSLLMRDEQLYQPPLNPELTIDTGVERPEQSTLHIVSLLEQYGHIAPLWDESPDEEEIALIKARLRALGYLE